MKRLGIKIIFVRTKIDETIEHEQHSNAKSSSTQNILTKVRGHCESSLKKLISPNCKVHLLSSFVLSNWDGNAFIADLIHNTDCKEKQTIPMSLNPAASSILSAKYEFLDQRIWKIALMSVSSGILRNQIRFYVFINFNLFFVFLHTRIF
jgi:hypothetical protein